MRLFLATFPCVLAAGVAAACGSSSTSSPSGGDGDMGGGASVCSDHADCDDADFCNGRERCEPNDASADTSGCVVEERCEASQSCDESRKECVTDCGADPDADGDGHEAISCGGDDCDDADTNRYPGNSEVCDDENHDEDCDPNTYGDRDEDDDGYVDAACCNDDDGDLICGDDCDDEDESAHPDEAEFCDDIDNDCDGKVDENPNREWFADADGDGKGDPENSMIECDTSMGYVSNNNDCDDSDPVRWINAPDDQCDGIDNDCDDEVDEDATDPAQFPRWYPDTDGDGYGDGNVSPVVECVAEKDGFERGEPGEMSTLDCNDGEFDVNPEGAEVCNLEDDDCDGTFNEGCPESALPGTLGDPSFFSGGTGPNPSESQGCLSSTNFSAGLKYDTFNDVIMALRLDCAHTEVEDFISVVWNGNAGGSGSLGGSLVFSGTEEHCPRDSYVTALLGNFNGEGELDGVGVECSAFSTEQHSNDAVASPVDTVPLGTETGDYEYRVACPAGQAAKQIVGNTSSPFSDIGLICAPVIVSLIQTE